MSGVAVVESMPHASTEDGGTLAEPGSETVLGASSMSLTMAYKHWFLLSMSFAQCGATLALKTTVILQIIEISHGGS